MGLVSMIRNFWALGRKSYLDDKIVEKAQDLINISGDRLELKNKKPAARPSDFPALVKRYKSWVYTVASGNAETVASVPLRVYVMGGTPRFQTRQLSRQEKVWLKKNKNPAIAQAADDIQEILDHPLVRLLRTFNDFQTGREAKELTELFLELIGNSYWYIPKDNLGAPTAIIPLLSQFVEIVPDKKEFILGYLYGTGHDKVKYLKEEIVHFRFANPNSVYYGVGPMQAALQADAISESEAKFEQAFYENGARPDYYIHFKNRISDEEYERFQKSWEQAHRGTKRAWRPAYTEGDVNITTLGFSPKDAQALLRAKYSRDEIADVFGYPVALLELTKSRAELEAQLFAYMSLTIQPRLRLIEETINSFFVPMFDDTGRLFVAYDNPVPRDKEFRLKERESNIKSGFTIINEERVRVGLEPAPWGYTPWLPANLLPVTAPREQETEQRAKMVSKIRGDGGFVFALTAQERRISKKLQPIFKGVRSEILRNLRGLEPKAASKALDPSTVLFNQEELILKLSETIGPEIEEMLIEGGTEGLAELGIAESFTVTNPKVAEFLRNYKFKFSAQVSKNIADKMNGLLTEALTEGETIRQIRDRVLVEFDNIALKKKAEMIARTESSRAQMQGQLEAWRQSGVVIEKRWVAFNDACPFCQDMDGKVIEVTRDFQDLGSSLTVQDVERDGTPIYGVDGEPRMVTMDFGYEAVSGPPLHPNCRCDVQAVTVEV